jgi:hypothetical protein
VPIQDLDVIWDREVAYELLGERHLSDVIWDREVAHEMNISEPNVLEEHAIGNGTLYMQTISAVSAEVEENRQAKDVRVGMTATRSIDGIVMIFLKSYVIFIEMIGRAKRAPCLMQ